MIGSLNYSVSLILSLPTSIFVSLLKQLKDMSTHICPCIHESRTGPEILGVCDCVYVKEIFLQIWRFKIFLKTYLYVIYFKNFRDFLRIFHLLWPGPALLTCHTLFACLPLDLICRYRLLAMMISPLEIYQQRIKTKYRL